jgi:hypothetical protein
MRQQTVMNSITRTMASNKRTGFVVLKHVARTRTKQYLCFAAVVGKRL